MCIILCYKQEWNAHAGRMLNINTVKLKQYYYFHAEFFEEIRYVWFCCVYKPLAKYQKSVYQSLRHSPLYVEYDAGLYTLRPGALRTLNVTNVEHDARMLLGHSNQTEVVRWIGRWKKPDEGVILEENNRAPRFEEFEKFQCSNPTLHGGVAAVGQRLEEIPRQSGVLVENENYLVAVKPTEPLAGVDGAEGTPKLKQSSVTPAGGRGEGRGERERDSKRTY